MMSSRRHVVGASRSPALGSLSGFTLVELLVVISIIALLVAILLPSLSKARQQTRGVVCLSQCRHLGVGMLMYGQEYGHFPPHQIRMSTPTTPDLRWRWFDAMAHVLSLGRVDRPATMTNDEWQAVRRHSAYFKVQTCPSVAAWEVGRNNAYGYNYKYLGSFRDNADPRNPHAPLEAYPVRQVRSPAATLAFADSDGTGWTMDWGPEKPRGDENPRRFGNHGYVLDPTFLPVWAAQTLSAGTPEPYAWKTWRTFLSDRHLGKSQSIFADGHGDRVDPARAYRDNALWNGLGLDPGLREDGTQDTTHGLYRLDPHLAERWDASSGQDWRYPAAL